MLADEATTLLHGREAAGAAAGAARAAFEEGRTSADLPTMEIASADIATGLSLAALAARAGLAGSNGEARRLAAQGGLRLNDTVVTDAALVVTLADMSADGVIKVAAGKKKIVLVRPV